MSNNITIGQIYNIPNNPRTKQAPVTESFVSWLKSGDILAPGDWAIRKLEIFRDWLDKSDFKFNITNATAYYTPEELAERAEKDKRNRELFLRERDRILKEQDKVAKIETSSITTVTDPESLQKARDYINQEVDELIEIIEKLAQSLDLSAEENEAEVKKQKIPLPIIFLLEAHRKAGLQNVDELETNWLSISTETVSRLVGFAASLRQAKTDTMAYFDDIKAKMDQGEEIPTIEISTKVLTASKEEQEREVESRDRLEKIVRLYFDPVLKKGPVRGKTIQGAWRLLFQSFMELGLSLDDIEERLKTSQTWLKSAYDLSEQEVQKMASTASNLITASKQVGSLESRGTQNKAKIDQYWQAIDTKAELLKAGVSAFADLLPSSEQLKTKFGAEQPKFKQEQESEEGAAATQEDLEKTYEDMNPEAIFDSLSEPAKNRYRNILALLGDFEKTKDQEKATRIAKSITKQLASPKNIAIKTILTKREKSAATLQKIADQMLAAGEEGTIEDAIKKLQGGDEQGGETTEDKPAQKALDDVELMISAVEKIASQENLKIPPSPPSGLTPLIKSTLRSIGATNISNEQIGGVLGLLLDSGLFSRNTVEGKQIVSYNGDKVSDAKKWLADYRKTRQIANIEDEEQYDDELDAVLSDREQTAQQRADRLFDIAELALPIDEDAIADAFERIEQMIEKTGKSIKLSDQDKEDLLLFALQQSYQAGGKKSTWQTAFEKLIAQASGADKTKLMGMLEEKLDTWRLQGLNKITTIISQQGAAQTQEPPASTQATEEPEEATGEQTETRPRTEAKRTLTSADAKNLSTAAQDKVRAVVKGWFDELPSDIIQKGAIRSWVEKKIEEAGWDKEDNKEPMLATLDQSKQSGGATWQGDLPIVVRMARVLVGAGASGNEVKFPSINYKAVAKREDIMKTLNLEEAPYGTGEYMTLTTNTTPGLERPKKQSETLETSVPETIDDAFINQVRNKVAAATNDNMAQLPEYNGEVAVGTINIAKGYVGNDKNPERAMAIATMKLKPEDKELSVWYMPIQKGVSATKSGYLAKVKQSNWSKASWPLIRVDQIQAIVKSSPGNYPEYGQPTQETEKQQASETGEQVTPPAAGTTDDVATWAASQYNTKGEWSKQDRERFGIKVLAGEGGKLVKLKLKDGSALFVPNPDSEVADLIKDAELYTKYFDITPGSKTEVIKPAAEKEGAITKGEMTVAVPAATSNQEPQQPAKNEPAPQAQPSGDVTNNVMNVVNEYLKSIGTDKRFSPTKLQEMLASVIPQGATIETKQNYLAIDVGGGKAALVPIGGSVGENTPGLTALYDVKRDLPTGGNLRYYYDSLAVIDKQNLVVFPPAPGAATKGVVRVQK